MPVTPSSCNWSSLYFLLSILHTLFYAVIRPFSVCISFNRVVSLYKVDIGNQMIMAANAWTQVRVINSVITAPVVFVVVFVVFTPIVAVLLPYFPRITHHSFVERMTGLAGTKSHVCGTCSFWF